MDFLSIIVFIVVSSFAIVSSIVVGLFCWTLLTHNPNKMRYTVDDCSDELGDEYFNQTYVQHHGVRLDD